MTTTTTKTSDQLYREYQALLAMPYASPVERTPEEQARDRLANSTWALYESTTELEILDLMDAGEEDAAQRLDRLFEVRERVRKRLKVELTIKKAFAALSEGEPEPLHELLTLPTYRQAIASFPRTPRVVLEDLLDEVCAKGAQRHYGDLYQPLAANRALRSSDLDRLITKARDTDDYRLILSHPNVTEAQFARIAHKNPKEALMRNSGLTLHYRTPFQFHSLKNEVDLAEPVRATDRTMKKVLAAAARSEQHDLSLWVLLDERSTTAMKRAALANCLPKKARDTDGNLRVFRTLPQRLAYLTPEVIARLEPEVRAMLVLYPHTPKRVLNALSEAGITRDVVLKNSHFPARGIDYNAYFSIKKQAA